MKKTDPTELDSNYISLSAAVAHAQKAFRSHLIAESVLKEGMVKGILKIRAKALLTEYACGNIRPLEKRRVNMQIRLDLNQDGIMLAIDPVHLAREPKGAQILWNWRNNHVAWLAPQPSRYTIGKVSGKPRAILPVRKVIYNVELENAAVSRLIGKLRANDKTSTTLLIKEKKLHRNDEAWKELFPDLFAAAAQGQLQSIIQTIRTRGGPAALVKLMLARRPEVGSNSTAKRIVRKLMDLDEQAVSAEIQRSQQLTKS
ncbi:hypothetical protein [Sphingomonas rubra]|uniref:Uncharacterized protein n=1 Tax=Sphingomonas rubra TaxID=634430 RepID=A0A1I5QH52_9SPHN|nr:hypothetical protein [Sphingomonas rubra]SFP45575.1 hypothetical protein SAMN04488241_10241 [Sphingomonas rubra]